MSDVDVVAFRVARGRAERVGLLPHCMESGSPPVVSVRRSGCPVAAALSGGGGLGTVAASIQSQQSD
ncbi:MAG: hypothetical protein ACLP01_07610, partial [Solirubrobacteraceae bacterium]